MNNFRLRLTKLETIVKDKTNVVPDLILSYRRDGQIEDWLTGITYSAADIAELRQSGKIVELASSDW